MSLIKKLYLEEGLYPIEDYEFGDEEVFRGNYDFYELEIDPPVVGPDDGKFNFGDLADDDDFRCAVGDYDMNDDSKSIDYDFGDIDEIAYYEPTDYDFCDQDENPPEDTEDDGEFNFGDILLKDATAIHDYDMSANIPVDLIPNPEVDDGTYNFVEIEEDYKFAEIDWDFNKDEPLEPEEGEIDINFYEITDEEPIEYEEDTKEWDFGDLNPNDLPLADYDFNEDIVKAELLLDDGDYNFGSTDEEHEEDFATATKDFNFLNIVVFDMYSEYQYDCNFINIDVDEDPTGTGDLNFFDLDDSSDNETTLTDETDLNFDQLAEFNIDEEDVITYNFGNIIDLIDQEDIETDIHDNSDYDFNELASDGQPDNMVFFNFGDLNLEIDDYDTDIEVDNLNFNFAEEGGSSIPFNKLLDPLLGEDVDEGEFNFGDIDLKDTTAIGDYDMNEDINILRRTYDFGEIEDLLELYGDIHYFDIDGDETFNYGDIDNEPESFAELDWWFELDDIPVDLDKIEPPSTEDIDWDFGDIEDDEEFIFDFKDMDEIELYPPTQFDVEYDFGCQDELGYQKTKEFLVKALNDAVRQLTETKLVVTEAENKQKVLANVLFQYFYNERTNKSFIQFNINNNSYDFDRDKLKKLITWRIESQFKYDTGIWGEVVNRNHVGCDATDVSYNVTPYTIGYWVSVDGTYEAVEDKAEVYLDLKDKELPPQRSATIWDVFKTAESISRKYNLIYGQVSKEDKDNYIKEREKLLLKYRDPKYKDYYKGQVEILEEKYNINRYRNENIPEAVTEYMDWYREYFDANIPDVHSYTRRCNLAIQLAS